MPRNKQLIKIADVLDSVKHMMINIQNDSIKIIQNKNQFLKEIESHSEFIEDQKSVFIKEQRKKIEVLHKYLDDKLGHIIQSKSIYYLKLTCI